MSKILRRPLFRGGRVDSTGVGITHGLDEGLHQSHQFHQSHHSGYATGGQVSKHMLEQNAPEGEFLAYINPREAALLKAHGGAGKATKYGIPSFEQLFESSLPQDVNPNDTGYINEKPLYTSSEMQAMTGTGEGGINATKAAEQIASKTGQAATNIGNKVYLPATIKEPSTIEKILGGAGSVLQKGALSYLPTGVAGSAGTLSALTGAGVYGLTKLSQEQYDSLTPKEKADLNKYVAQQKESTPVNIMGDVTMTPTYEVDKTLPAGYTPPLKGPFDLIGDYLFGKSTPSSNIDLTKKESDVLFGSGQTGIGTETGGTGKQKLSEEQQLQKKVDMYSKVYGLDKAQTQSIYNAMLAAAPGFLSGRTLREAAPKVFENIVNSKAFDKPQQIREAAAKTAIDEQIKEELMDKKTQQLMNVLNTKLGATHNPQDDLKNLSKLTGMQNLNFEPRSATTPIQMSPNTFQNSPEGQSFVNKLRPGQTIILQDPSNKKGYYAVVTGKDKNGNNIVNFYDQTSKTFNQTTQLSDQQNNAAIASFFANQQYQ
jgi:hypothetical protein